MKRLFKLVTIFLVAMTILMPVLECFDRWDRPGLGNDTELPLFLIMLFVSFVLMAVAAIAARAMERQSEQTTTEIIYEFVRVRVTSWTDVIVPAVLSPPLRT